MSIKGKMQSSWRQEHAVYVAEADTLGALGVIRSLGRAGYPVHAVSSRSDALGFASRFTTKNVISPPNSDPKFLDWFRSYLRENKIKAVIPSEDLLLTLRPTIAEFTRLIPWSADPKIVYSGLSKFDLFEQTSKENLPPTLFVNFENSLPTEESLGALGLPLFIKVDAVHALRAARGKVVKAVTVENALRILSDMKQHYSRALVQGYVEGRGVGVFFVVKNGKVLADFMHQRIHEVPHTGGVSSYRSGYFDEKIRADALSRVLQLGWEGPAMLEYRKDEKTERFFLMEMNGRFWGSVHLALYSGVDFPRILLDAYARPDLPMSPAPVYRRDIRCRHIFPGEAQYVWSRLKDRSIPILDRLGSVVEFFFLSFNPRIRSDLSFPGDRGVFWVGLNQFAKNTVRAFFSRLSS
jgi:predicted ATP-grasp superfamily ATP-dependent carboligase